DEGDGDGWNRASLLFDTLGPGELLEVPAASLLNRLFHEEGVQVLGERPLRFGCSCSRERVASMLRSLGGEEARAAVVDGRAEVRCEFYGERDHFDPDEFEAPLAQPEPTSDAPTGLQ